MVHVIYLRKSPRKHWQMVQVAAIIDAANITKDQVLKEAYKFGYDKAEVIVKSYDVNDYIPVYPKILEKEGKDMVFN